MSQHNKYLAFFVGLVTGGLIGAIIAVLFAPQAGIETRTWIKEKSIELGNIPDLQARALEEAGPEPFGPGGGRPTEA